jgi:DNA ligase (NAD+)
MSLLDNETPAVIDAICRAGKVIPHIAEVLTPALHSILPKKKCPSCGFMALDFYDDTTLRCLNNDCCERVYRSIEYFFETIDNCDGFGPATIEWLKRKSVSQIYAFAERLPDHLKAELDASRLRPLNDYQFLAAFGIPGMGLAMCEKLLQAYPLNNIWWLKAADFMTIDGFGAKTALGLEVCLTNVICEFDTLMDIGFNLIPTQVIPFEPKHTNKP